MPCTLSTQKRARLAPAPAPMSVKWKSLPFDQVRGVGDCLLANNDIDDYMAFRAVCHDWRSATKDNPEAGDGTDPAARFIPTKWALLGRVDDLVTLFNVDTGRFVRKRIPLLRQFSFVGATSGGLILLEESAEPHRARVLNPFTGSIEHFKVRMPCVRVRTVAMTTKPPLTIFISTESESKIREIMWADQSMESFKRFWMAYPNKPTCITSFGGNLYATDGFGSIYMSTVPADAVTAAAGELRHHSEVDISMDAISPTLGTAADIGDPTLLSDRYYLVESAGDLLLVTKPSAFVTIDHPVVRRVNTETRVIEPVSSIGSRALFVSHVRCLSINADKFPSIQAGCVYFLEPTRTGAYYYGAVDTTIVHVADNVVVEFAGGCCSLEGLFRPFTLAQVITHYCKSVHYSKLYRDMMMSKWGSWDDSYDYSESSSSELDDEESSSEHNDDEASSSKPADD